MTHKKTGMAKRVTKKKLPKLEAQVQSQSQKLYESLRELRDDLLHQESSLIFDSKRGYLHKQIQVDTMDGFMQYQMHNTPQWMGISILEVARKAIENSTMTSREKLEAFTDLQYYYSTYNKVCRAHMRASFEDGIALADHARESIFDLLLEYGLVKNRKDFNVLRNAGVMWRLGDRMSVETTLDWSSQDKKVSIVSTSWPKIMPGQDKALEHTVHAVGGECSLIVRYIIRAVQRMAIRMGWPVRARTGSQERDWYAPNAQITRYQIDQGRPLVCWTNGDLRTKYAYHSQTIDAVLWRNIGQLLLNATGLDLGLLPAKALQNKSMTDIVATMSEEEKQLMREQMGRLTMSVDVYGRPIHLEPICLMNECQSFIKDGLLSGALVRKAALINEEHVNIKQREQAIAKINRVLAAVTGVEQTLFSLNTPLAVHGRKFFTYHDQIRQTLMDVTERLLSNYGKILCMDEHGLQDDMGLSMCALRELLLDYISAPHQDKIAGLENQLSALHARALRFVEEKGVMGEQADKVIRSLCCFTDTLRHWLVYQNSRMNAPEEVLNFTSSLITSCALLSDASMINIKCKSGKDRTGVMLQSVQTCYDHWSDRRHFDKTLGLPLITDRYDCESKDALAHLKTLLASGAWPTAVAQDCQCAALKSLGAPVHHKDQSNTFQDRVQNVFGMGALSEKMRTNLGQELLRYHSKRSMYNGDFHRKVKPESREKIAQWMHANSNNRLKQQEHDQNKTPKR